MRRVESIDELLADANAFMDRVMREMPWESIGAFVPGIEDFAQNFERQRRPTGQRARPNHYAVLGVHPNTSPAEIQHAYRRLARRWHPDRVGGDAARMAAINAAYEALRQQR